MSETLDEAALLAAELVARRWLPRTHPAVRKALIDEELWRALEQRLANVGLRIVDNIFSDYVAVALLKGAQNAVFGEAALNANNNLELSRDAVSLLIVLWALIILPKRELQAARSNGSEHEHQAEMFQAERPMPSAASVSPIVSYKALLTDYGHRMGKKTRMDANLKRLENHGFITRRNDEIGEGPLMDLLLDYDTLAPCILEGALAEVLARTRAEDSGAPSNREP